MELARLEKLKTLLVESKDLPTIFTYFLDHFAEDMDFLDLGAPARSELLEAFIAAACENLYRKKSKVLNPMFVRIPEAQFIHGACIVAGHMVNAIYFEEIQVGLAAIAPSARGEITQFSRFTGRKVAPEGAPSDN